MNEGESEPEEHRGVFGEEHLLFRAIQHNVFLKQPDILPFLETARVLVGVVGGEEEPLRVLADQQAT
jgi:hypothetical protein